MATLLSNANVKTLTDNMAKVYAELDAILESGVGEANLHAVAAYAVVLGLGTTLDDYYPTKDLLDAMKAMADNVETGAATASMMQTALAALDQHMSLRGSGVDSSIVDIATYATYYNKSPADPTTMLYIPEFGDLYNAIKARYMEVKNVSGDDQADMGHWTVAGGFVNGSALDETKYGLVKPKLVVTGGGFTSSDHVAVVVTGKNHLGATGVLWHYTSPGTDLGDGTYYFTEAPENGTQVYWIRDVTGIAITGGSLAGSGTAKVTGSRVRALP